MRIVWTDEGWDDYLSWHHGTPQDEKILKRIHGLIEEIRRTPFKGTGKPEPLKYDLKGFWSRRINDEHRIVYSVSGGDLTIIQCRFHY